MLNVQTTNIITMYAELSKTLVSTFPPFYNQYFRCFLLGVFKITVNNYLENPKTPVARNKYLFGSQTVPDFEFKELVTLQ